MPLIPLNIPPGVYRNGTDYQSQGRWNDASLVRWTDGTMQPVSGWLTRVTVSAGDPVRGALAWTDNSGDRWLAAGTPDGLYVMSASNVVSDITPVGLTAGSVSAAANLGYGGGFYGTGAYGVPRPDIGALGDATTWSMDNWGQNLIACSDADGVIYEWALNTGVPAAAVANAPIDCVGALVTDERFLFALAPGGDGTKVQWSDREDNTLWTPDATNEAGDYLLQTHGKIMLGIRARGQSLIITTRDAHAASYVGPPFVYGFERVGTTCGAISRKCAAAVDLGVFWMGRRGFFLYSGGSVQPVPCEVADYVFSGINRDQASKVHAVANAGFSEVWWFYPSAGSVENDRYVAFNYKENHWAIGSIDRTAGVDAGVFSTPIWLDSAGVAYNHEIGNSWDGGEVFAQSGPIEIGNGDQVASVLSLIPDEKTQGDVSVTFKTRFYPNAPETTFGPYSMANPTDTRFTGRQLAMRVVGGASNSWRAGIMRADVKARGRR